MDRYIAASLATTRVVGFDNTLGNYNPTFFAAEALQWLHKSLGFAARVYMGLDNERNTAGRSLGEFINIKRPLTFEAEDHVRGTGSSSQDVGSQDVQIQLARHKEVKFAVTDVELAYSSEMIINDHIRPAAYALADDIDKFLHGLGSQVGPKHIITGSTSDISASTITRPRAVLRKNECPDDDLHYLVDTGMEARLLELGIFHEARITGPGANEDALMRGSLGMRFGVEVFGTQNADVTAPDLGNADIGDKALAVNLAAGYPINVNTIAVDGGGSTEAFAAGDSFSIAGDVTKYILTSAVTLSSGAGNLTFYPALQKAVANNAIITFDTRSSTEQSAHLRNLMFHRNAFALGFAPLPMTGDGRGAQIDTVSDPVTGLSVRARMYYNGDTATNYVALDTLYGGTVLNAMMATRVLRSSAIAPA